MKFWSKRKLSGLLCVLALGLCGCRRNTYVLAADAQDGRYPVQEATNTAAREPSSFRIRINAGPEVVGSDGLANLMIGNPEENCEPVRVRLVLDATGEELYRSAILQPGERLPYGRLTTIPEPGDHAVTAVFSVLDEAAEEITGEIEAGIRLTVE